jgi:hypothetical protein
MREESPMAVTVLHFHLPQTDGDNEYVIHLHAGEAARFVFDDELTEQVPPAGADDERAKVDAMLDRLEAFDSATPARHVDTALTTVGFEGFTPRGRGGVDSPASYVRYSYAGSKRRVSLYLNSGALLSASERDRELMGELEGAEVRPGEVYFHFAKENGVENAIAAAEALRRHADGE